MSKEIIRFPYSNVAWQLNSDNSIKLKISKTDFDKHFYNTKIINICNGGLLESLLSCILFEYLKLNNYKSELYWSGNLLFNKIIELNGLASIKNISFNPDIFSVPLFSDQDYTYINSSYNIINITDIYGNKIKKQRSTSLDIIYKNLFLDVNINFLPKIRNLKWNNNLDNWAKNNKILFNKPFVLIIPDRIGLSTNSNNYFNWSINEIKSFASVLKSKDINTIIMSNKLNMYHSGLTFLEFSLDNYLNLINNAKLIMAKELDLLILPLILSNCSIAGLKKGFSSNILNYSKYFNNKTLIQSYFTPKDIWNFLEKN